MQNLIKELSEPVITPSGIKAPTTVMLRAAKTIQHLVAMHESATRAIQQLQAREMTVLDELDPLTDYQKAMNEDYTSNFT